MNEANSISVIIPAHNEERSLPEVLSSVLPLTSRTEAEVLVVDVGSTDRTAQIATARGCRVLPLEATFPGVARNLAAREASSEVLAFVDGDVVVTQAWIDRVLEILRNERPLEGILTGAPYGIRPGAGWIERTWFKETDGSDPSYINGGNLLLRRDEFLAMGGFDEGLPTGEDYELCERAKTSGFGVVIDRDLKTIHLGNPRSVREFLVREGWHGTGDFTSLSRVIRSKVALATIAFLLSLIPLLFGLILGNLGLLTAGILGPGSLCLGISIWKWREAGFLHVLAATPIVFLYLSGRSLGIFLPTSLLARWRSNLVRNSLT